MSEKAKYIRFLSYLKATHDRLQGWKQDCATLNPVIDTGDIEKLLKSLSRHGKSDQRENLQLPVDCLNEIFSYLPSPVAAVAPDANHDGTAVLKVIQTCGLCLFLVCENPSLKNREEAPRGVIPRAFDMIRGCQGLSRCLNSLNMKQFSKLLLQTYGGVEGILKIFGTHPTDGLTSERAKILKRVIRPYLKREAYNKEFLTTVIRDGKRRVISSNKVVPGDLLVLGGETQFNHLTKTMQEGQRAANAKDQQDYAELYRRRGGGWVPYNSIVVSGTIEVDESSNGRGQFTQITVLASRLPSLHQTVMESREKSSSKLSDSFGSEKSNDSELEVRLDIAAATKQSDAGSEIDQYLAMCNFQGTPCIRGGAVALPKEASMEATAIVFCLDNPLFRFMTDDDAAFQGMLKELNLESTARILAGAMDEMVPTIDSD